MQSKCLICYTIFWHTHSPLLFAFNLVYYWLIALLILLCKTENPRAEKCSIKGWVFFCEGFYSQESYTYLIYGHRKSYSIRTLPTDPRDTLSVPGPRGGSPGTPSNSLRFGDTPLCSSVMPNSQSGTDNEYRDSAYRPEGHSPKRLPRPVPPRDYWGHGL